MYTLRRYPNHVHQVLLGAALMIAIFGLGIRLGRHLTGASSSAATRRIPEYGPVGFIRKGDTTVIPAGSPLYARLLIKPVLRNQSPRTVQLPATVEADPSRTVNILPPVTGRVVRLMVRLGDHVRKGQSLAIIESADLAQAYADDDKARDALQRAEMQLERTRQLHDIGASSMKDLEQARSDAAQARAERERTEARLKEVGVASRPQKHSRFLTLQAPIAGSVTTLTTAPGAFFNDLTAPLMTIADLGTVWITANVPEEELAHVASGQMVDVAFPAYPGRLFHGRVSFVSDVLDADTRRDKVRIVFPNPAGQFKPNMFASATFHVPQRSTILVPNSALLMDNDHTFVWLEVAPHTFIKRSVVPGYGEENGTRIDSGLESGDRIIVKGGVLLND